MKTFNTEICSWPVSPTSTDYDIDWPRVQRVVGTAGVGWLINQPLDVCQMVLEKRNGNYTLIVEFADDIVRDAFNLMIL